MCGGEMGVFLIDVFVGIGIDVLMVWIVELMCFVFMVYEEEIGLEYCFVLDGFVVMLEEIEVVMDVVCVFKGDFLVFSGLLLCEVLDYIYVCMVVVVVLGGVKVVLDIFGKVLLMMLKQVKVFFVKLSFSELEMIVGKKFDECGIVEMVWQIVDEGWVDYVIVMFGCFGVFLVGCDISLWLLVIYVFVCFVVGVGDSFFVVLVWKLEVGVFIEEVFCFGFVVGVVVVLIFGIELCRCEDVFVIYEGWFGELEKELEVLEWQGLSVWNCEFI